MLKEENVILPKSYAFGLRILNLYLHLTKKQVDWSLSSQILYSETATGENVEDAVGCSSGNDLINKLQITYKEARETRYWLNLVNDAEIVEKKLAESFHKDCEELLKIQTTILNSSERRNS